MLLNEKWHVWYMYTDTNTLMLYVIFFLPGTNSHLGLTWTYLDLHDAILRTNLIKLIRRFDCGTFCGNSLEEILQHLWNTSCLINSWLSYG